MIKVTHAKIVNIADDAAAAAKGEVLPSDWNANHIVTGGRTVLTADATYFVSATGSDSNGGTNSTTDAWATLQHAAFFIAGNIDFAGFNVTVRIGAGSFVGFGVATTIGGGNYQFIGAGSANTTITNGPNDGVYNFGEGCSLYFPLPGNFGIDGVTFSDSLGKAGFKLAANGINATLGQIVAFSVDLVFDSSVGADAIHNVATSTLLTAIGPIKIVGHGTHIAGEAILLENQADFIDFATWTLTNPANTYDGGFVNVEFASTYTDFGATFTGTAHGPPYQVYQNSSIASNSAVGILGPNHFPGDLEPLIDFSSSYDAAIFAIKIAGIPSTATGYGTLPQNLAFGAFKDSSAGPRTIAFNDGGTIYAAQIGPFINTSASTNYTLAIADQNGHVEMNNGGANTVTVPSSSSVKFPVGTEIRITQVGAGATTVTLASTLMTGHNFGALSGQWGSATLYKRGADEWVQTSY